MLHENVLNLKDIYSDLHYALYQSNIPMVIRFWSFEFDFIVVSVKDKQDDKDWKDRHQHHKRLLVNQNISHDC